MPISLRGHLSRAARRCSATVPAIPHDRNAKARIMASAKAYNARHRKKGQHWGPLTRSFLQVLEVLLWGFHNSHSGRCYPSYERIAEKARCCRDTVCQAIKALETAGILTWVNRLARIEVWEPDLFGNIARRRRAIRTSNAYLFATLWPGTEASRQLARQPRGTHLQVGKSARNPDSRVDRRGKLSTRSLFDLDNPLHRQLLRLGMTLGHI